MIVKESVFQQRLNEAMHDAYMTQSELCEKTGITKSAMSQYCNGKIVPRTDKIYLLAEALDVNPAWLMGFALEVKKTVQDEDKEQTFISHHFITKEDFDKYTIPEIPELKSYVVTTKRPTVEEVEEIIKDMDIKELERLAAFIEYQKTIKRNE